MIEELNQSLRPIMGGALAMGFGVAGLFFLRFWRKTQDRLFALFALAMFLMASTRIAMALLNTHGDRLQHLYWVRFIAFLVILLAILDKNRPENSRI